MAKQASTERIREYDRLAKLYDKRLGLYARETIEEAVRLANLAGTEAVIDTCCGTGELLQQIALREHQGPLVGIDFSQSMINVAQHHLRSYPHIVLHRGSADQLDFPDGYFHVAFNTNAFRYLDQPKKVLNEIYRVLRPHGRLVLVDFIANSRLTRLWALFRRLWRPYYRAVYRSEELERLLHGAGFVVRAHRQWRVSFFWKAMLFEAHKPAPDHHHRDHDLNHQHREAR